MMESDKELMKNDIIMVTKISLQIDYSNRTKVKEIYDALTEREILKTSIGNNYLKRLEKIYHGEEPNHTCVICDQESGNNPIICKKCLSKIQIVRNETESGKEEVFQTEDRKNLQEEANKGIEKGMKLLNEQIKNADKFVSDTAKVVNEKSNKVIQTINEKSIVKNPISSKKKKWIWVISILFGCYIISKAFGLDSSINEDDMITLIGQNVSDTNMLYGEGKLYDAINAVTYSNGLAVNFDSEDTLKIIYVIDEPIMESVEIKVNAFKVVSTFDVSQTDGKELPSLGVDELTGGVDGYGTFLEVLKEVCPVPITFEDIEGGAKGFYSQTEKHIAIQEGMSEAQTVKTAIHEMAHQKLHAIENNGTNLARGNLPEDRRG